MLRRLSVIILIFFTAFVAEAALITNAVRPVYYFSGRENELRAIDETFKSGERIISIVGISGIGKTELIRKYISDRAKNYSIIWIFESNSDLRLQFQQLAKSINAKYGKGKQLVSEELDFCKDSVLFFIKCQKDWLFVFDNLRIGENGIVTKFISGNINGHIIALSQDKNLLKNTIDIDFLDYRTSQIIVKKINANIDKASIEAVYRKFSGHPVLLAQCAYLLKDNSSTFLYSLESEVDGNFARVISNIVSQLKKSEIKLLIKAASLDNHLLMKNFMLRIESDEKDLLGLNRINLLMQRKTNNKEMHFEMHDLIKANLLAILDKKLVKDNIGELVDQVNDIFPNNQHLYGKILNEYPNLIHNLECLLEQAELHNINLYQILRLRKNLMMSYLYRMDYKQYKNQLNWFAKNKGAIITDDASAAQLLPMVIFLVDTGMYKRFIEDKTQEAISAFEEAIKIIRDKNINEIKCFAYYQYAQALLSLGEVDAALEKVNMAQQVLSNSNSIIDFSEIEYTFSTVFLEKGEYENALVHINKSLDAIHGLGNAPLNEPVHERKSEILLRAGKYQEALKISKAIYKRVDGYFDKDHDLKNRTLIFLAWAEIGRGNISESEKAIARTKAWYGKIKSDGDRKGGKYLTYISIVEGDIAIHKKNYAQAVGKYIEAGENLSKIRSNLKNDLYGFILEKIVKACVLAKKNAHRSHYLIEYEKVFGYDDRARRMSLL